MRGNFNKIILSEKEEKYLKMHYKHTKNSEIAQKLGISETSLHRFARMYGLTKSKQFMAKCNKEGSIKARIVNKANNWPPKGYRIPNSDKGYFKNGETNLKRLGKKRNDERIRKAVASRAKTFKTERGRAYFGLPQQTKLKVIRRPRGYYHINWYLGTKCGYILDRIKHIAYYSEATKRARILEKKGCKYYRFLPAVEAQMVCQPN